MNEMRGIGVGKISTGLSENVGEIDGEAFYTASEALERAKKENYKNTERRGLSRCSFNRGKSKERVIRSRKNRR